MRYHWILWITLGGWSLSLWGQSRPDNPHGPIRWDCMSCHTTSSWWEMNPRMEFRHQETGYPLLGEHQFTDCISCHRDLVFSRVGTTCADCHTDVHRGELGLDCQGCHTADNWQNRQDVFQLHASRNFPLTGVHALTNCEACHTNDQRREFTRLATDCNGCHLADFQRTANPRHPEARFSTACESCHQRTALTWGNTRYVHPAVFELRGAHVQVDCNSCHAGGYFNTPSDCYSCHAGDYRQTVDPAHEAGGFPRDCAMCHNEVQWAGAFFDHNQTGFPLTGQHQWVRCTDCHTNNRFAGTPTDCYSCHQDNYAGTTAPPHVPLGYPTACEICHNTTAWEDAQFFDHNQTNFPLVGQHLFARCLSCHENNRFAGTPTDCYSCHREDYENTTDPDHQALGFPTTCELCHTPDGWRNGDAPGGLRRGNTPVGLPPEGIPRLLDRVR
ncbi:MAG: hypothetical protein D6681_11435 [Calditrichaeota bacterium]|nr:MAG: hypothetical protein D6681_11435 [Calditrichota bacterium]